MKRRPHSRIWSMPVALGMASLCGVESAAAQTWDVTTAWSDDLNPFGPWSLCYANGTPFDLSVRPGAWSCPQLSWGLFPGWFKSNGCETVAHDWIAGDVITHSAGYQDPALQGAIRWTSPIDGWVQVTGTAWWGGVADQFFRANDWWVARNGVTLTGAVGTIGAGCGCGRNNQVLFTQGSGGPFALDRLRVHPGDYVQLVIGRNINSFGGNGAYTGVTFVVNTIDPPGDFNVDGQVAVQDVFDFLAAWFAGNPLTDFDHDGQLTVADIFAFINAWFE